MPPGVLLKGKKRPSPEVAVIGINISHVAENYTYVPYLFLSLSLSLSIYIYIYIKNWQSVI